MRCKPLCLRTFSALLGTLLVPLSAAATEGLAAPGPCAEPHPGRQPIRSPGAPPDAALASVDACTGRPLAQVSSPPPATRSSPGESGLVEGGGSSGASGSSSAGDRPLARVASLVGEASAERPGVGARPLACGDTVNEGERVVTAAASSAGLLVGELLAQLGADSVATLGRTEQETAEVSLERGGVRVVDAGSVEGAPARVAVLGAEARISGNDAEAHVVGSAGGAYALLCGGNAPLQVAAAGGTAVAQAGACLAARPGTAPAGAAPQPTRIAVLDGACDPGPPLDPPTHLIPLPPTGAGPPGRLPPLPDPPTRPPRSPCDNPGGLCLTTSVTEQDPTTSGFPGGTGSFPGD